MNVLLLSSSSFTPIQYVKEGICQGRALPAIWPPTTLATIGAICKRIEGVNVRLVDANALKLTKPALLSVYKNFGPDIVFLNTTTPTFPSDLKSAELARQINPSVTTIMIGTHVSATAEDVVSTPYVDIVIRNEPERIALNLITALANNAELKDIKGITYKDADGVVSNPDESFIENLDELPWPDRSLLDNSLYVNPLTGKRFTIIRNSRGCPGGCIFCVGFYYGKRWRSRSVSNIIGEIEQCTTQYNITDFLFNADLFTKDKNEVINLCREIINSKLGITWICNSRVDSIDEELLQWMEQAGCQMISFGIESASEDILSSINKGIDCEKIIRAINLMKKSRIKAVGYFTFGLPGETKASAEATIKFAIELPLDYVSFFTAVPYPGTEFGGYMRDKGLLKTDDWSRYDETQCDVYDLSDFTAKELQRIVKKAYIRWYFRPTKIMRELRNSFTPVGLKRNLCLLTSFLKTIISNE